MNREQRRRASKQERQYNFSESQKKAYQRDAKRIAYMQINIMWAAVFIVAHEYGIQGDRLMDFYHDIARYLTETETAEELRRICYEKTGLEPQRIVTGEDEDELERGSMLGGRGTDL